MNKTTLLTKRKKAILIVFLLEILLTSCGGGLSTAPSITSVPTNYKTEFFYILETVDSPNNTSLQLEIALDNDDCYAANSNIPVKLKFINTSQNPLFLQNRFYVSKSDLKPAGDITVTIYLPDGRKAFDYYHYNYEDWPPLEMGYLELGPHDTFIHEFIYRFPDKLITLESNEVITEISQTYKIVVSYNNYDILDVSAWVGFIQSNRETICIK